MKRNRIQTALAAVAWVAMVLPLNAFADHSSGGSADVALRAGGMLVGQVVDQQGVAQADRMVSIRFGQHEVARTATDQNGVFAVQGLRGGQYELVTDDGLGVYRLWAAETAPPTASDSVVLVSGQEVVRGQWHGGYGADWLNWIRSHPYITAGIVAAAVAIPVAVASQDDDGPNS